MKITKYMCLGLGLAGLLLLSACASDPGVRWAQTQTAYNDTLDLLITYRRPCVPGQGYENAGPDHPGCLVSDDVYRKAELIRNAADLTLRKLDAMALAGGDGPDFERMVGELEGLLTQLLAVRIEAERAVNPDPG